MSGLRALVFASLVAVAAACGDGASSPPPPVKPGVLSVSADPRLEPFPTTAQEYGTLVDQARKLVHDAGVRGQMTTWTWKELEPTQGTFDANKFSDVDTSIAYASKLAMVDYVGIQVINTSALEVPPDLASTPLDDPAMQTRFKALLDRVITPHKGAIKYLSIGNEVDAYLRAHPADWPRYKTFYVAMAAYAKSLDPALQVGVTGTTDGALTLSTALLKDLASTSDVVILTYYPLNFDAKGTIRVRDPNVVSADLAALLAFAGSRPLVLQEVGYPAAPSLASSEEKQAAFVSNVFAAWKANPGRIPFLNFFLLHDLTSKICSDLASYYGVSGSQDFYDFLCTLGLRKVDGTPRPAWNAFVTEAAGAGLP